MIVEAKDFAVESGKLAELLAGRDEIWLQQSTLFKAWTVSDIVRHLLVWNQAALMALTDEAAIQDLLKQVLQIAPKRGIRAFEALQTGEMAPLAMLAAWHHSVDETVAAFLNADPKQRLTWAGPSMSARSAITARLMETWAHGQAIYDLAGVERQDGDHIRGIAELGVRTFGWSFQAHGQQPPGPQPSITLAAPSGENWSWPGEAGTIEGPATEFCQVVTQTRNIADTTLHVDGETARAWMAIAQCFAGPPETPPQPGERHRHTG